MIIFYVQGENAERLQKCGEREQKYLGFIGNREVGKLVSLFLEGCVNMLHFSILSLNRVRYFIL